jgi:PilZ domain
VKKRIGDRRGRERFEIVGLLTGTLETWSRYQIRDVGAGGALIDSVIPLSPGSRISGRLTLTGQSRDVRAEVRHITTLSDRSDGMRYWVGVQWDPATRVADLLSVEQMRPVQSSPREGGERRTSPRFTPGADAEIGQPNWFTVELVDLSTTGVLFGSPTRLEMGDKGKLRVRLGDRSFSAEIEVRRSDPRKTAHTTCRLGAQFVSLDEGSRLHLEDFIGDARH